MGGTRVSAACASLLAAALVGFADLPGRAHAAVTVHEATILGPSGSVHHVATGGFEAGFDWVLTQGINNPEVNAALWEAPLSEGAYQVEAFIPRGSGYTFARYDITHAGHNREVRLRQSNFGDTWIILGDYDFDASQSAVRSTDAAGYPGEELAWAAMRWTFLPSLPPNVETNGTETTINEPTISGPEEFVVHYVGIGYRGDLLRVYSRGVGATAVNSAVWSVPSARGEYAVEAFIPNEHAEAEVGYTVYARDGTHKVVVLQKNYNNLWVPLGNFRFSEAGASVASSDATSAKPDEEITWDALRFKLIKLEPAEKEPPKESEKHEEKPPEKPVEKPGEPTVQPPGPTVLPPALIPETLLEFAHLRVKAARHHRPNPQNLYKVTALLHAAGLTVRYHCGPCLVVSRPFKLRKHTSIPRTHRSLAEGDLQTLIDKETELYAGSVLDLEVAQASHRPALLTYHLRANGKIKRSPICPAPPGPIGACPS